LLSKSDLCEITASHIDSVCYSFGQLLKKTDVPTKTNWS